MRPVRGEPKTRRWGAALAGGVVAALALAVPARTAGAADGHRPFPLAPVGTWVDPAGHQQTVVLEVVPVEGGFEFDLVLLRDLPTGQPDPAWIDGDGTPGQRTVALDAPPGTERPDPVLAVDAGGRSTIVWRSGTCGGPDACGRSFQVIDADGTVGAPTAVADVGAPQRGLPDGSVLVARSDGTVERRSPSGAIWSAPEAVAAEVAGATVDQLGRTLVLLRDGTVRRSGVEGALDLEIDSGCTGTDGAIGPSAVDDGFATACGSVGAGPVVTRWSPTGALTWTTTDGVAPGSTTDLARPTQVVVAGDGSAWVGGVGLVDATIGDDLPATVVARFTPTGPEAPGHRTIASRPVVLDGFGVSDLRALDGAEVAFAADQRCCGSVGGDLGFSRQLGGILPERPSPPTCRPGIPTVIPTTSTTTFVGFTSCPDAARPVEQPTGYRVEVVGGPITRTGTVGFTSDGGPAYTTITEVRGGVVLVPRAIAINATGDSLGGWVEGAPFISPFSSVEAWAHQQYLDLLPGPAWAAEGAEVTEAIAAGTLAPDDLVADLLQRGAAEHRIEPVARTYQAALGRTPDTGGLRYWVGRSAAGLRLAGIAEAMSSSPEFARRFGGLSDRGFVAQVYRNVLGREGDPAGIDYWTRRLRTGVSRGGLVAQFAQSSELVRRSDPTVQPIAAAFSLFGRVPTPEEAVAWATATPRQTTARAVLATATYSRRFLREDR